MNTPPPNVLWICTDQQRVDTLGCYGNPFVHTPNLDRLANDGMRFANAFCQSPVCTPSRASFLTGRYPRTTRCRQNGQSIPDDERIIPKVFHDAGYTCGLSGKLHLSACNPAACPIRERRIDDGYDQFYWSHDTGDRWPANEYIQHLEDHRIRRKPEPSPHSKYVCFGPAEAFGQTAWCIDRAITFIRAAARTKTPWLFSVNVFDPHHPFDPPREAVEHFGERLRDIPLPCYTEGELASKPVWQTIDHQAAYGGKGGYPYDRMTDEDHRWIRAAYWAMVEVIDRQVGRLLDFLEQIGQRDNTIIVFMSDHGEMLGDHGIYLKGPYCYDCGIHVPLIMTGPGIRAGSVSHELVELIDLAPALLDAAGLDHHPGMQGRSIWPILTGEKGRPTHRNDVICEFYGANFSYEPPAYTTMIRTQTHKLTVAHDQGTGELYDLEQDPREIHNRWDDPAYADLRHRLLVRLADRMAWTADPLPERQAVW